MRQRLIANLGRVDQFKPGQFDPLIRGLQRVSGQLPQPELTAVYDPARGFGDLYVLHALWQELGLGAALRQCLRSSRRRFDAEALVRTMVFNRLSDPRSKLGLLEWLDTVAMPDCPMPSHQQLLRAMDALVDGMEAVEEAVCTQVRPLLDQSVSLVFYDLTTIRISGESKLPEDIRRHGYNKQTKGVARQFVLGVVQSAEGIALLHTVAPGNVSEAATLRPMLEHALKRFNVRQFIVIADRGLLSLDNIGEIQALAQRSGRQLDFILALPARQFAARQAKLAAVEAIGERLADTLNAQDEGTPAPGRRATDRGAYARFARELKDRSQSRLIKIDWKSDRFSFDRNEAVIEHAEALDGKLFLVTSLKSSQFDAAAVVARYKSLADIERGFRVLKSDIEIAPVHHRLEVRLRAHALICFLALLLHRVMRLRAGQTQLSVNKALVQLKTIQQHRVEFAGRTHQGISRISDVQRDLFADLKIPTPALNLLWHFWPVLSSQINELAR